MNPKYMGLVVLLVIVLILLFYGGFGRSATIYSNQCSIPSCPSGYTSVDTYCDESKQKCYRECEKQLSGYCGNYGSWSYKSKECSNYGVGGSCTTPHFYESSDKCYQFYAKTTVNYPLTLNGAIRVKATNSWDTEYSGCVGYTPVSVSTSVYNYGRGSDGSSRTASGSYSSCGSNAVTSATKIKTQFYYRTASVVEEVDTTTKSCSYDCNTNKDCGTDGYIGSPSCKDNNAYQMFRTYKCLDYVCSYSDLDTLKESCLYGCLNGVCGVLEEIDFYRFSENQCNQISILESEKTINDYSTLAECQVNIIGEDIIAPPDPSPSGFSKFISSIINWLKNIFSTIFGIATITGSQIVEPNTIQTYQIDLSAPIPDSDWSDGTYQVQYANWALIDSSGNIIQEGTWEKINGKYQKSVTITTPSNIDDFALLGMITQFDITFNEATGQWTTSEERIVNKEAIDLKTKYTIEEPEVPFAGGFGGFIGTIINWLKGIWQSIFG